MSSDWIEIRGAREHNLRNVSVRIPRERLVVITGLSGSGKSSLAFDTLYAEGQRRYVESLSAYARQFLGQMEKPDVDSIEGLSPAISIDQKTTSRNPRSTVGTVTEIYDYLRLLFARVGHPHCHVCGRPIAGQSAEQIVDQVMALPTGTRFTVDAPVVRGRKGEFKDLFESLRGEGFTRVKVDGETRLLEEGIELDKKFKHDIAVVVDRLVMKDDLRKRLADSVETALALAEGLIDIAVIDGETTTYSEKFACPEHGVSLPELRAARVLVQLAARRLPGLPRPRCHARARPRHDRARRRGVDLQRRAAAVERVRLELLRERHPRGRRPLRRVARDRLGRPARRAAQAVPVRHRRPARAGHLQEPPGPQAPVHDGLRGHHRRARPALPRDRVVAAARAHRGVHDAAAVPDVQRRAPAARVARRHGREPQHPHRDEPVGGGRTHVDRRPQPDRHRER